MVDVDVDFEIEGNEPVNAEFEVQPNVEFVAELRVETPIKDHDKLNNRDLPDQHPISAITGLETALNNESQAIAALDDKIDAEISRAEGAESILDTKIETEKTRATTAENVLQNNIDVEESRARQAESDLNTAIQTETNRAESTESALSNAISAETTRAEEAESTLQTNINNESSRAQQAETNLSTAISNEQTRAETTESGLSADISAEVTARQNADTALQANINTEIANRANADTALGVRIDNETSARESADDTLQDNIDSEASTRESEITRVEGLISAETTRATNAEQANSTSISNHMADKNNPHEVSKAQVGLGNVDNTSDANKPISTATRTALNAIGDEIDTINSKIPAQASSTNQLADREFVNSSISTNTANFIDTFASVSDLESYTGTVTNNDYAFVVNRVVTDNGNDWATFSSLDSYDKSLLTNFDYAWVINGINFDLYRFDILQQSWDLRAENIEKDDVSLNTTYNRYKATVVSDVVSWKWEYSLNNSSFTAEQWEAINSGATQDNIAQISINTGNITTLSQTKQDNITSSNMLDADLVDDSTSANKFVTSADITNWNAKQNAISDLETIRSGAAKGATSVQSVIQGTTNGTINVDGSDVAVKGLGSAAYTNSTSYDAAGSASQAETNAKSYADSLSTNYATAAQGEKADTAVQPSDLATVATSGSYNDLNNTPTIGDATLTIQKNGTTVDTFTANSTVDKTVNIEVPTNNNQLTNGAGYQTASDVATAISGKQDTLVSGTNIKTINGASVLGSGDVTISNAVSFAGITGQPSDNTNLATALNAKANDSDVVKLTGSQTIAGTKTFSNPVYCTNNYAYNHTMPGYTNGTAPSTNYYPNTMILNDSTGNYFGFYGPEMLTNGSYSVRMGVRSQVDNTKYSILKVGCLSDGTFYTSAPTPATSDNSTQIATTANVDAKITAQAVKLTGNQTLGTGMKGFTDLVEFKNGGQVWSTANNTQRDSRYNCKFYQYGLADSVLPSNSIFGGFHCFDKNNFEFGAAYSFINSSGTVGTCLWVHTPNGTSTNMGIYQNASGVAWTSAPTPATTDNSTKIATTAFVKAQGYIGTANLATCHVIIQTYVNGTSWYRVWSDGWIEQGGIYTGTGENNPVVSLLKTMANTNYYANCVNVNFSSTNNYLGHGIKSKQTATLTLEASYNKSMNIMWMVCGQGA